MTISRAVHCPPNRGNSNLRIVHSLDTDVGAFPANGRVPSLRLVGELVPDLELHWLRRAEGTAGALFFSGRGLAIQESRA